MPNRKTIAIYIAAFCLLFVVIFLTEILLQFFDNSLDIEFALILASATAPVATIILNFRIRNYDKKQSKT